VGRATRLTKQYIFDNIMIKVYRIEGQIFLIIVRTSMILSFFSHLVRIKIDPLSVL
jgi:hypothetical protein